MSEIPPEDEEKPQIADAERLLKQVDAQIQARRATTAFSANRSANRQVVWLVVVVVIAFAAIGALYFLLSQMAPQQRAQPKQGTEQTR